MAVDLSPPRARTTTVLAGEPLNRGDLVSLHYTPHGLTASLTSPADPHGVAMGVALDRAYHEGGIVRVLVKGDAHVPVSTAFGDPRDAATPPSFESILAERTIEQQATTEAIERVRSIIAHYYGMNRGDLHGPCALCLSRDRYTVSRPRDVWHDTILKEWVSALSLMEYPDVFWWADHMREGCQVRVMYTKVALDFGKHLPEGYAIVNREHMYPEDIGCSICLGSGRTLGMSCPVCGGGGDINPYPYVMKYTLAKPLKTLQDIIDRF